MHIHVGLDHGESSFLSSCESCSGVSIAIVYNLELSGVNGQNGADEELVLGDTIDGDSLEEHSSVFQIVLLQVADVRETQFIQKAGELTMSIWPFLG